MSECIVRSFQPVAITALVALSSRPTRETPFDLSFTPSPKDIVAGVAHNYPSKDDALQYIQGVICDLPPDDANATFKLAQYTATIENIRAIVPKAVCGTTRTEGVHCYILYRCSMGLCGKDLRNEASFEFCDVIDDDTSGSMPKSNGGRTFTAALRRPCTGRRR